jgi:ribosomal protein S12 methylthiotransferase
MPKKPTVDIITMGCSKNLVDSEMLMGLFEANGYHVTHDAENPHGDIAVVNTCGFIEDAKQESIDTILELAQAKEQGRLQRLYVMGCLSERYLADLEREIPEVDGWYGKFNYKQLLKDLNGEDFNVCEGKRHITTPKHYAYIKISEGCDRHCAYCAIPLITGRHQSRPMQEILDEVRWLVSQGTSEFQVIAQELTYYGVDIDGKQHIAELIEQMADIEGVEWIRLHYAYPAHFPWDLLRVMREKTNVCNYLDIALQHISDHMLERMQRHVSKQDTYDLIERLRREVPGIHIRTTLMVGFPGETDDDFQQLIDFTKWARFERMGAFAYSEEEGTYSALHYADDVPQEVKQARLDKLMRVQQNISAEIEAAKVGTIMRVVIDRREGDWLVSRSEFCSPEVDPEVLIPAEEQLVIGEYYQVRVTDSEEFDLYATSRL